ncbi:hypothetical protein L7F22_030228 [Adiantum nelumboides]|nr:hypothetical protein [Adiantum nelumboides]
MRDENFDEGSSSHGTERASHDEDALFKAQLVNFMETFQQLAKHPKMQELLQGSKQVVTLPASEKEDSHAKGSYDIRGKAPMVERQQVVKTPSRASGLKGFVAFRHDTVNDDKEKAHVGEQPPVSIGHKQPSTHGLVNGQDSNEQVMRQTIPVPLSNAGCFEENAYGAMQASTINPMYGNIGVQPGFDCAAGSYGMPGANMGMACFSQPYAQNLNMTGPNSVLPVPDRFRLFVSNTPGNYAKELIEQEKAKASASMHQEVDLDDLINDPELESLHAERIAALKQETEKRQALEKKGHGDYRDVGEADFLAEVTGSDKVVCHFYHHEFVRCKIIDKHLKVLAPKYFDTKFIRVDAENSPFFVAKLAIKTLPCVVLFRDGVAFDRLVGFQDLGGADDFSTSTLENWFLRKAVLTRKINSHDEEERAEMPRRVRSTTYADTDSE